MTRKKAVERILYTEPNGKDSWDRLIVKFSRSDKAKRGVWSATFRGWAAQITRGEGDGHHIALRAVVRFVSGDDPYRVNLDWSQMEFLAGALVGQYDDQ